MNNLLLTTAAATVLLGTLYPLVLEGINGSKISVGPPYFNATFVPLMVPLIAALAVGPLLSWKRADLAGVLGRLKATAGATIVTFIIVLWTAGEKAIWGAFGIGIAVWLTGGVLTQLADRVGLGKHPLSEVGQRLIGLPRSAWGMSFAHFGLAIFIVGATAMSLWQEGNLGHAIRPNGDGRRV